jgi:hypothetical protein
MVPSFFAICKTKEENISIESLTNYSSFERLAIDLVVSRPQKTFHSSNIIFA